MPATIPKRNAASSYRLVVETSTGSSYTYDFSCLGPDVWQGALVVDNPPPGQPADPSDKRPDGRDDVSGADGLLLPFVDYLIRGDFQAAYGLCALEYRSVVVLAEFRAGQLKYTNNSLHETKVHSGADARRLASVVTETVYGGERLGDGNSAALEQRGFNGFFTVAPTPGGYGILDFHLRRFRHRLAREGDGPEHPLLI